MKQEDERRFQKNRPRRRRPWEWIGRSLVVLLSTTALATSILSIGSCGFYSFRRNDIDDNNNNDDMDTPPPPPPFLEESLEADMGLFRYRVVTTKAIDMSSNTFQLYGNEECLFYYYGSENNDDNNNIDNNSEELLLEDDVKDHFRGIVLDFSNKRHHQFWIVAQCCAVLAIFIASLGWCWCLLDCFCFCCYCCCNRRFWFPLSCFLVSFVLQCCTFLVFLDNDYCFEDNSDNDIVTQCRLELGGWYSVIAIISYWSTCAVLCCLPSPRRRKGGNRHKDDNINPNKKHNTARRSSVPSPSNERQRHHRHHHPEQQQQQLRLEEEEERRRGRRQRDNDMDDVVLLQAVPVPVVRYPDSKRSPSGSRQRYPPPRARAINMTGDIESYNHDDVIYAEVEL